MSLCKQASCNSSPVVTLEQLVRETWVRTTSELLLQVHHNQKLTKALSKNRKINHESLQYS